MNLLAATLPPPLSTFMLLISKKRCCQNAWAYQACSCSLQKNLLSAVWCSTQQEAPKTENWPLSAQISLFLKIIMSPKIDKSSYSSLEGKELQERFPGSFTAPKSKVKARNQHLPMGMAQEISGWACICFVFLLTEAHDNGVIYHVLLQLSENESSFTVFVCCLCSLQDY